MLILPRTAALVIALVVAGGTISACSGDGSGATAADQLTVEASFYPLAWVAGQVGGDHLTVRSLTKPGAEPHDLELTPSDVASVTDADLVVYLSGFQPAVDEAVAEAHDDAVFDARPAAKLDLRFTPIEEGQAHSDEAGSTDPHFWLDPTRLAAVTDALASKLSSIDPDHATDYEANANALTSKLSALDGDLTTGLAHCTHTDLVTSHNAFGYLARRYGLSQVGITGLTPESEPSPADLAKVTDFVRSHGVKTIYFETLVSPDIANAVSSEAGVSTDVLDPIEGLNDESQGRDYLEVMRANLSNLRKGQGCT
jgi:zinc transport system substrate-binding protein